MSENNQTEHGLAANTQSRRVFMRRAGTGAVIAALPMKSVWANGITTSIIASGNGSNWVGSNDLHLCEYRDFQPMFTIRDPGPTFASVFGGPAKSNGLSGGDLSAELTFFNILKIKDNDKVRQKSYKGPSNYNRHLVAMYLNAKYNGQWGIVYPVVNVSTGRPFASAEEYALRLYELTKDTAAASGKQLGLLINDPTSYSFGLSP